MILPESTERAGAFDEFPAKPWSQYGAPMRAVWRGWADLSVDPELLGQAVLLGHDGDMIHAQFGPDHRTFSPDTPIRLDVAAVPRTARIVAEVTAGLLPGRPDPEFTQRYVVHSDDWLKASAANDGGAALGRLLSETNGRALGYAGMLMLQPDRLNWVRTEWIYL